jgi:hypothetical protein
MPRFHRENNAGAMGRAYTFLLIPVVVQVIWFLAGTAYSVRRKRWEAIVGISLGFGMECVALVVPTGISASSHY